MALKPIANIWLVLSPHIVKKFITSAVVSKTVFVLNVELGSYLKAILCDICVFYTKNTCQKISFGAFAISLIAKPTLRITYYLVQ